jgi:hypothetical protein
METQLEKLFDQNWLDIADTREPVSQRNAPLKRTLCVRAIRRLLPHRCINLQKINHDFGPLATEQFWKRQGNRLKRRL